MANRIRQRREQLGLSQQDVADAVRSSQAQINRLEAGERKLTQDWLERLAPVLRTSAADLLLPPGVTRGPGPGHKTGRRAKPAPGQMELALPIPEIDLRAGAGFGGEVQLEAFSPDGRNIVSTEVIRGQWQLPPDYLAVELHVDPRAARIVEVVGDSMSPSLESGDRVLINIADRRPSPGGIFALWDGLAVVLKRIEHIPNTEPAKLKISSDNPRHETYERTIDEVSIIGRARWRAMRL